MAKIFNVSADCKPDKHYMVDLTDRFVMIKELIDEGEYYGSPKASVRS